MALVVVTQNQYILAKAIHHIVLNENYEYHEVRRAGKLWNDLMYTYHINIVYTPDYQNNNSSRDERAECSVQIRGKVAAYKVYKDLVHQIREQMPDQLYLDKAIENLLNRDALEDIENSERRDLLECEEAKKETRRDRSTKKIRRARKAKRAGKAVLRKSKARR